MKPSTQISRDDPILFSIKAACHEIAIRFLAPVYLVGSFLTDPENAGDIDIIIVMSRDRHKRLFGDVHFNDKQLRWRRKQKESLEDHLRVFDFDFKPQTPEVFECYSGDKLRLDSVPDNLLLPTLEQLFSDEDDSEE